MRKILVLSTLTILYLAYTFILPSIAMAQGPVEQCLIPLEQVDYTSFGSLSENVHASTGWVCGPTGGAFQECDNTLTDPLRSYVANTSISKFGILGDSHPPLRIELLAGSAFFDVYVGGAQLGQFTGGAFQTYVITVAQGIVITDEIKIVLNGDSSIASIQITELPLNAIEKDNNLFVDPNSEGVDWPSWTYFYSGTTSYNDYGSRETGISLVIDDDIHDKNFFCTPINIDSRLGHTDIITVNFDFKNNSQITAKFNVVDTLQGIELKLLSDPYNIAGIQTFTITAPIEITPALTYYVREAFFCMYMDNLGTTNVSVDNFNSVACQISLNIPCQSVYDNEFDLDYDSLYQFAPLATPPIPSPHWLYPSSTPPLFYEPPVVAGVGNNTLQLARFEAVGHSITTTTPSQFYQIVFDAKTVAVRDDLPLEVGFVDSIASLSFLNTYPATASQVLSTSYTFDTVLISKTINLEPYTVTVASSTAITNPLLVLRVPDYGPVDVDDYIEIDNVCVYQFGSILTCTTIPDYNFTLGQWQTDNNATVTTNGLEFVAGGTATNSTIITTTFNYTLPYNLVVNVVTTTLGTDLYFNLGDTQQHIAIDIPIGIYTAPLEYLTPFTSLVIYANGAITIDFVCLYPATLGTYILGECITSIVKNGTFETDNFWVWQNGATHNAVAQTAWLPYAPGGTLENGQASAFGQVLAGPAPLIPANQHLILQFDAWSITDNAQTTALYYNNQLDNPLIVTNTYTVSVNATTYQTDFDLFSDKGGDTTIGFINSSYEISATTDIQIDNVCLYVSTTPYTSTPTEITNTLDIGPTCSTVTAWLSDTVGVDLPALENAPAPSIWEPREWVPWLGAKLWFWLGKPIACLLIALVHDYLGLRVLNWIHWTIAQPAVLLGWWATILNDLWAWLVWAGQLALIFLDNPLLFALWLLDLFVQGVQWGLSILIGWVGQSLNFIILAWNTLSGFISQMFTDIVNAAIEIWNSYISPFFSQFLTLAYLWQLMLDVLSLVWDLVSQLFTTFWLLLTLAWEFLKDALYIPVQLYHALTDAFLDPGYSLIPNCNEQTLSMGCYFIAGISLFNAGTSQAIGYPFVITLIILLTILFFWYNLWPFLTDLFRA